MLQAIDRGQPDATTVTLFDGVPAAAVGRIVLAERTIGLKGSKGLQASHLLSLISEGDAGHSPRLPNSCCSSATWRALVRVSVCLTCSEVRRVPSTSPALTVKSCVWFCWFRARVHRSLAISRSRSASPSGRSPQQIQKPRRKPGLLFSSFPLCFVVPPPSISFQYERCSRRRRGPSPCPSVVPAQAGIQSCPRWIGVRFFC